MIFEKGLFPEVKNEFGLVGIDEVGRGPLAGPVVTCGVGINLDSWNEWNQLAKYFEQVGVTDSKALKASQRQSICRQLRFDPSRLDSYRNLRHQNKTIRISMEVISEQKIDQINILAASLYGMGLNGKALKKRMKVRSPIFLIDGNKIPPLLKDEEKIAAIIKGDMKSKLISLASIFAKETRDFIMKEFGREYPNYGFERHAGYPTAFHREAIAKWGVLPIHRKTFAGVKEHLR